MGILQSCNDSVRSIQEYGRRADVSQKQLQPTAINSISLTFTDANTHWLDKPYNDPLIIELIVGDCEMAHILVDTGSLVDLIFKETLDKMDIKDKKNKVGNQTPYRIRRRNNNDDRKHQTAGLRWKNYKTSKVFRIR